MREYIFCPAIQYSLCVVFVGDQATDPSSDYCFFLWREQEVTNRLVAQMIESLFCSTLGGANDPLHSSIPTRHGI